jgi:ribosomal RNA-processing protein 12
MLAEYLENGDLLYFMQHFYSITKKLDVYMQDPVHQGLRAQHFQRLSMSLWRAFPKFFIDKSDANLETFKTVIPTLCSLISKQASCLPLVCEGLCIAATENSAAYRQAMREVEEKFLPVMFNFLLTQHSAEVYQLISVYPMSPLYAVKMMKRILQKVLEGKAAGNTKNVLELHDLLIAVVGKLQTMDPKDQELLLKYLRSIVEDSDQHLQKKAYRVLIILADRLPGLAERFLYHERIEVCAPLARLERLKLLKIVVKGQPLLNKLPELLPELIVALREQKQKSRDFAEAFAAEIVSNLRQSGQLMEYVNTLSIGLTSENEATKAGSIDLFTKLIKLTKSEENPFQFAGDFKTSTRDLLMSLLGTMQLLLRDSKEVKRAVLTFTKHCLALLPPASVRVVAQGLVEGMFAGVDDNMQALKIKVKYVLEKLLKKLGYQVVSGLVPVAHTSFLNYVVKELRKKKKPKKHTTQQDDEDPVILEDSHVQQLRSSCPVSTTS